jgi:DNA-binding beta-propeller fold protein YncE
VANLFVGSGSSAGTGVRGRFIARIATANGATDNVSVLTLDLETGQVTPVPGSPFSAGENPEAVAADPLGRFLYVTLSTRDGARRWGLRGLGGLAVGCLVVLTAGEAGAQTLTLSPASGVYATTQAFDLALILTGVTAAVTGGSATFDGVDVAGPLVTCVIPGTLVSGGRAFGARG